MPSWLITGASRGIGLSLAETLLKDSNNFVIATARNPESSPRLAELKAKFYPDHLAVVTLDVTSDASVAEAVKKVETIVPNGLDYLVNNAGIDPQPLASFNEIDLAKFEEEVTFNVVVPVRVTRPFIPLIRKSEKKKVIIVSSALGSIQLGSMKFPGLSATYSVGKAALNILRWVVLLLNGCTKNARMSLKYHPTESTEGLINVAKSATFDATTSFYNYEGSVLPWWMKN